MKNIKLIEVVFEDITFFTDTIKLDELEQCVIQEIRLFGYLVKETKDMLVIACALYKDGKIGDFYIIPKHAVISKKLKGRLK